MHGSRPLKQYITKKVLLYFPTLLLITVLVFLLMRVIPGDPAIQLLAAGGDASYTEEELAKKRAELGIDRSLPVQYVDWIWGMLRGDLGLALYYQRPVVEELSPRIPITFEIAILAMIISVVLAVPLGIVSAVTQDSLFDYVGRGFTIFGISVPIFVTGIVSIYILARVFNWLPPFGYAKLWEAPWENLQQIFFPALTLAIFQMNFTARVTRSAMLEVLREDYIRTRQVQGASRKGSTGSTRSEKRIIAHIRRCRLVPGYIAGRLRNHRANLRCSWPGQAIDRKHSSTRLQPGAGRGYGVRGISVDYQPAGGFGPGMD